MPNRFLPLGLFPFIRLSITSISRLSPPSILPIQFFLLLWITSTRLLSSCTTCRTASFVLMTLQLIFSIFLHTHISKASSLWISSFLYVQVSAAWRATLHIIELFDHSFLNTYCIYSQLFFGRYSDI